jgi:hypothetical protein
MDFFNKYITIINDTRTKNDAINIIKLFDLPDNEKKILYNYVDTKKFDKPIDFSTMIDIMKTINNLKYKEEVYNFIEDYIKQTTDNTQIKTFARIANLKPLKPHHVTLKDIKNINNYDNKNCPHCNNNCIIHKDTIYMICGLNNNNFDWNGCGMDWCFKCGKKLCKQWINDQLFLDINRKHDKKCCKNYALNNNLNYEEEFCMCENIYVNRNIEYYE